MGGQVLLRVLIRTDKLKGGPAVFRSRLIKSLNELDDISVTESRHDSFDIELSFVRHRTEHNRPKILRLDGCYYQSHNMSSNKSIADSVNKSDFVIYQSEFSKRMCDKVLRVSNKRSRVIHNGIDFDVIDAIKPDESIEPGSFVACAKWRPIKRPRSMALGFLESTIPSTLYVIGDGYNFGKKHSSSKSRIVHLGSISENRVLSVMKACSYQMHFCFIDSCPNSVIEGLVCGLNVLCTNLGGSREIIGNQGIVMDVDSWNWKPISFDNIDKVPPAIIAHHIHELIKLPKPKRNEYLSMDRVVSEYANVLRRFK
jgi:glycosyltransferase involved in cell wall biosynthesis